jgi:uncharacterized protein (TIGR02271 family)
VPLLSVYRDDCPTPHVRGTPNAVRAYVDRTKTDSPKKLRLLEDDVELRRHVAEAGTVRLGKKVREDPVQLRIPFLRESVVRVVEKRLAREPAEGSLRERRWHLPLFSESVSVIPRTVAAEEVRLSKRMVRDDVEIPVTRRREELDVESVPEEEVHR